MFRANRSRKSRVSFHVNRSGRQMAQLHVRTYFIAKSEEEQGVVFAVNQIVETIIYALSSLSAQTGKNKPKGEPNEKKNKKTTKPMPCFGGVKKKKKKKSS